ncbi:hypothetical protein Tco_0393730 [Tanacetum coccineum]
MSVHSDSRRQSSRSKGVGESPRRHYYKETLSRGTNDYSYNDESRGDGGMLAICKTYDGTWDPEDTLKALPISSKNGTLGDADMVSHVQLNAYWKC